ncbi:MAG: DUF932 domain-containing protein [Hyphomonadaceae bacterium]|nr:DUF932 domain-containing protein [Hyphomonadaceae bacterium]
MTTIIDSTATDVTPAPAPAAPAYEPAKTDAQGRFKVSNLHGGRARMELSNQWYRRPADERFLSLSSLEAHVRARAEASVTLPLKSKAIECYAPEPEKIEDTHVFKIILPDGSEAEPTHFSFGQLAGLAGAPAGYLRTMPSQITKDALNYGLRFIRRVEDVKLYVRPGEDLRAITGNDYGRIYDHEVVEAVRQVAGDGTGDTRWKIPGVMDWRTMIYDPNVAPTLDSTTLYSSDRDVFIFLVDDRNPIVVGKARNGEDDVMFRGFYFKNSEVGAGSCKLGFFYLRGLCENRIMWGVEGFEELTLRHSKNAPARFVAEAIPAMRAMAERSSTKLIEAVQAAKEAVVAKDDDSALDWLKARTALSVGQQKKVLELVEQEEQTHARSVWDMAQGITALARSIPHQDDRFAMEKIAGGLLNRVA